MQAGKLDSKTQNWVPCVDDRKLERAQVIYPNQGTVKYVHRRDACNK